MSTSAASLHPFVYLASQSPRRQELLQQLGVRFELLLPRPDEDAEALEAELPGERARDYVQRVCVAKAHAARARLVAGGHAARPILVADTTVTIDDAILGKPVDADDAVAMLTRLAGRAHEVLTAVAVVDAEGTLLPAALSVSKVRLLQCTQTRSAAMRRAASRSAKRARTACRGALRSLSSISTGPIQVSWVCRFLNLLPYCVQRASTSKITP